MDSTDRRFARLTHLVLDGVATDAERAELAGLSAAQPEHVTAVFDELTLDALLKWQSGNIIEELPFLDRSLQTAMHSAATKSEVDSPVDLDDRGDISHRHGTDSVEDRWDWAAQRP